MPVHTIRWVRRQGGGVPETVIYKEAPSQSYKEGDILVFDTSDEAVKLATDTTVAMKGIAQKDATGVTGAEAPVLVPTVADVFSATISNAGANSAAAHDPDNNDRLLSWIKSTETGFTSKTTIDEADGTNHWVKVLEPYVDALEPLGTAGGRVLFTFLSSAIEGEAIS